MPDTTTAMCLTTESLLAAICAGDEEAAAVLVQRYEPMLFRLLRVRGAIRWLQGELSSQDLVQSVFLRAFAAIHGREVRFSDEAALESFLKTLARNRLRDHIRGKKAARRDRRRTVSGDVVALDREAGRGPNPSQVAEVREMLIRVEGCALPADLDVLRRRVDGATWQELAASCGSTPEALRQRIQRVRQQIRDTLSE